MSEEGPPTKKRKQGEDSSSLKKRDDTWTTVRSNELFETYYKAQKIVPDNEWDMFMNSLKQTLPITFRIGTTNKEYAEKLQKRIKSFSEQIGKIEYEGKTIEPPKILQFYPNQMAWHYSIGKGELRKIPVLKEFREFIMLHTAQVSIFKSYL